MSLPPGPKIFSRAAVSFWPAASIRAWAASCGVAKVCWAGLRSGGDGDDPRRQRSCGHRKCELPLIVPPAAAATLRRRGRRARPERHAAPERYAPGPCWSSRARRSAGPRSHCSMPPNTPRFCAGGAFCGNLPIAEPLALRLRRTACAAVAPAPDAAMFCRTLPRYCVRSVWPRYGTPARCTGVVRPDRSAAHIRDVGRVEVVLVDERVVDDHGPVAPAGMPTPSAPSMPAAAEHQSDIDAAAESEAQLRP